VNLLYVSMSNLHCTVIFFGDTEFSNYMLIIIRTLFNLLSCGKTIQFRRRSVWKPNSSDKETLAQITNVNVVSNFNCIDCMFFKLIANFIWNKKIRTFMSQLAAVLCARARKS